MLDLPHCLPNAERRSLFSAVNAERQDSQLAGSKVLNADQCVLHYLGEKHCVLGWILGVVTSKSIETSQGKPLQSLVLITRCTDGLLVQTAL